VPVMVFAVSRLIAGDFFRAAHLIAGDPVAVAGAVTHTFWRVGAVWFPGQKFSRRCRTHVVECG